MTATRWDTVEKAPGHLAVRAERWTVDHLDLLELSTVTEQLADAASRQSPLVDHVDSLDLTVDPAPGSTTDRVLTHLVVQAVSVG